MSRFKKIALFSDDCGLPVLLECVPREYIGCIVVAAIRPEQIKLMEGFAKELTVPLLVQPLSGSEYYSTFLETVGRLGIDLFLCNSYSMLLRGDLLRLVNYRAVNAHASLLPRNRGPNPIQWALIHGEAETGVSLHVMDERFDGGAILHQAKVAIDDSYTWVDLRDRLAKVTRDLWRSRLLELLGGCWSECLQDEVLANVNPRLNEESPRIDFQTMNDEQVYNLIRAQVAPLAGAYVELPEGGRVRFPNMVPMGEIEGLRKRFLR